jgi:3'-phosphoadenosine 5'-phosphosulfate sulfotransferase (PAPS reductase)/FAD synthetase
MSNTVHDPFKIEGPACISFSGGRTSGYMLWRILQAYGGKLPDDVVVCFANTGKEMTQTLDFVKECSDQWNVQIVWLEYGHDFDKKVTYRTASRHGEPFASLIKRKNYLPNPVTRFCTSDLKVKLIENHCKSIGLEEWTTLVGIRADEPRRVAKIRSQSTKLAPLAEAGIVEEVVEDFWSRNDFDLDLPYRTHSNCDLCFLKGAGQIMSLIRENHERALWWIEQEKKIGATFRSDRPSYAEMYRMATQHGELFSFDDEPIQDCACTD